MMIDPATQRMEKILASARNTNPRTSTMDDVEKIAAGLTVTITDADRARLRRYMVERARLAFGGTTAPHADLLLETFARHREAALEEAARAFKSAQYSPAPYTDGMKALRRLMDDPA